MPRSPQTPAPSFLSPYRKCLGSGCTSSPRPSCAEAFPIKASDKPGPEGKAGPQLVGALRVYTSPHPPLRTDTPAGRVALEASHRSAISVGPRQIHHLCYFGPSRSLPDRFHDWSERDEHSRGQAQIELLFQVLRGCVELGTQKMVHQHAARSRARQSREQLLHAFLFSQMREDTGKGSGYQRIPRRQEVGLLRRPTRFGEDPLKRMSTLAIAKWAIVMLWSISSAFRT